ncbi:MAG TPA: alkaline phosphatase family protein [Bacteroidales bacterium]|nr:alkaline phosphatase family protein [Bacteroidales bacterium]
MKVKIYLTIILVLLPVSVRDLVAQSAYIPPEKPKLVIGIVIEQFRYDYIDKFWDIFSDNGFRRLINEGTFCKNASYDFFFTQSAPAHATLSTGTDPGKHGIVADNWYLPLRDEIIYCTGDSKVDPVGGSFEHGLQSPANLLPSTFGDELKLATYKRARVFGIGMKNHAAILSAGHAADCAYWYDDMTGTWMTSTHYIDSLPSWVSDFNDMRLPDTYLGNIWEPLLPLTEYTHCLPDTNSYESGISSRSVFPYNLKKISSSSVLGILNKKTDYSILPLVPFGNTFTNDFAIRLIDEEKLGEDDITDFLSISYTVTDNIGHLYGPSSMEMADAIVRFDRDLGHLLDYIIQKIGKKNVLIYLTSAHGIAEIPEVLNSNKIPAGHFKQNQALTLLKSYLNVLYGQGSWVKGYYEKQVYLNHVLIEDASLPLNEVQGKAARFLSQYTGVSAAVAANVIENNDFTRGYYRKMRNSFDQTRSGDIILNLEPAWVETGKYVTNHNSAYDYDSHVPLIWYGWTINRSSITREVNMNEVAATLSSLCKIQVPNACTGNPMIELFR